YRNVTGVQTCALPIWMRGEDAGERVRFLRVADRVSSEHDRPAAGTDLGTDPPGGCLDPLRGESGKEGIAKVPGGVVDSPARVEHYRGPGHANVPLGSQRRGRDSAAEPGKFGAGGLGTLDSRPPRGGRIVGFPSQ